MSINTIIEEQKKEFYKKCDLREEKGGFTYLYERDDHYSQEAILNWHIKSIKQILEAEVERLKGIRNTRVHCCQSDEVTQCEYDECLDDQITHLTNIIKEIK